jgi:hypothetical protein
MIINIIDFLCSLTLVVSIYICGTRPRLGWFIYFINAFFYCFLMFYKGLLWMGISGIILGIIGLRNFRRTK